MKYAKKCKTNFFQNYRGGGGGHGPFWPGGGYAHDCFQSKFRPKFSEKFQ